MKRLSFVLVWSLVAAAGCSGDSAGEGGGADGGPDEPPGEGVDLFEGALATDAPGWPVVDHGLAPTPLWGELEGPYPTNTWWLNLVLGGGESAVNVLPFMVKALPERLSVCAPALQASATFVLSVFHDDVSLGAAEEVGGRVLAGSDPLSATVAWSGPGDGRMTAPLVRGMGYATMRYEGLTPRITTQHAIVSINGGTEAAVTGARFELELNNGQRWILYASEEVTLERSGDALAATGPFTGWVRATVAGDADANAALDAHAGAVPVGGRVRAYAGEAAADLVFEWETEGDGAPLMLSLPHHRDALQGAVELPVRRRTIKGEMIGVAARRWTLREPLPAIPWTAPRAIPADRRGAVREALLGDASVRPSAGDPYFFGKQIAAMGRLALIADELGEAEAAAGLRQAMAQHLEPWLTGGEGSPLVYDRTWGGIIAAGAQADPGAAFGQGYYNDHHFHYGYFLYAAAALARGDAAWAQEHRAALLALARNIANPSRDDPYFTVFRNKDWFVGHSWAAGLFEFADSRNQESSSEAVNAWYGLSLLGEALGDARLRDLGRVLLATELRSVHRYWQMRADSDIYPAPFRDNKAVGVLWSTKVEYATFFGGNVEFIHGIQMLPFTPITELLLPRAWIAEAYPVLATALVRPQPPLEEGWRGFVVMAHAILDPAAAWAEALTLGGYDDGNTRTNTLYWIATRP